MAKHTRWTGAINRDKFPPTLPIARIISFGTAADLHNDGIWRPPRGEDSTLAAQLNRQAGEVSERYCGEEDGSKLRWLFDEAVRFARPEQSEYFGPDADR